MSTLEALTVDVRRAREAAASAHAVRERLRRRTDRDDPARREAILAALGELSEAMRPLRRTLAGGDASAEARAASQALQRERRALRKMLSAPSTAPLPEIIGVISDGSFPPASSIRDWIREN